MGEKETADEGTNLNSSKSNRVADEEGAIAIGEEGLQHSGPSGDDPGVAARTAQKTRSNIQNNREAASDPVDDGPESAEGTIVKSKSNITNN